MYDVSQPGDESRREEGRGRGEGEECELQMRSPHHSLGGRMDLGRKVAGVSSDGLEIEQLRAGSGN